MKNKFLLWPFIFLMFTGLAVRGQSQTQPFDFLVKPGTKEWNQLKSGAEKISILTIPLSVLTNLNTTALAQTCLNYPLFYEIHTANNIQRGFTALKNNFNGFQELLKRKDAGSALINIYKGMNVKSISKEPDSIKQGDYTFRFTYIELLLAQNEIIEKLTQSEKQILKKLTLSNFDAKTELKDQFGEFGLNTSALILGKLLKADGKQELILKTVAQKDLDIYLNTATFSNKNLLADIYNASQSY